MNILTAVSMLIATWSVLAGRIVDQQRLPVAKRNSFSAPSRRNSFQHLVKTMQDDQRSTVFPMRPRTVSLPVRSKPVTDNWLEEKFPDIPVEGSIEDWDNWELIHPDDDIVPICIVESPVNPESSSAMARAYNFFNLNRWRGQDHDIKFVALLHTDRQAEVNYGKIRAEMEENIIQYDKNGELNEKMKDTMRKVKKGDKIYLLIHGWVDSYDSPYEISGICEFIDLALIN